MEIFLVLFLLSGQVKAFMEFFGLELPVDITLLTAVLLLGFTAYKVIRKNTFDAPKISFFSIGLLLLFYAWMIFSLFYTDSESYSLQKTLYFLLNIAAFAVPFFFKQFNIRLFFRVFTIGTIILAVGLLPFQYFDLLGSATDPEQTGAYSAIGGLYLSLSEYLGLIVILILTQKTEGPFLKGYDVVVVMIVLGLMLLLGARGPILFVVFVYGLYYLSTIKTIRFTIRTRTLWWMVGGTLILAGVLFLMILIPATNALLTHSVDRFVFMVMDAISGNGQDNSTGTRLLLMGEAFNGIFKNIDSFLFGYGIGSFGSIIKGIDMRLYPHNMILEIWFELGLVGLSLFVIWILYILLDLRRQPVRFISYWLLLYVFLNLMKSSSLIDIRTEFAFLALFTVQNLLMRPGTGKIEHTTKFAPVLHPSPATNGSAGEGQG